MARGDLDLAGRSRAGTSESRSHLRRGMFWKIEDKLSAMGYKAGLLDVYGMALLIDFKEVESLILCPIIFAINVMYFVTILENYEFLKIA